MPYWNECPRCGAKLDPGERCDCLEAPPRKIVTMEDWEAAGSLYKAAKPGDVVEDKIVNSVVDSLPPATLEAHLVQCGEPYCHTEDPRSRICRPTFLTFKKTREGWVFCGCCFMGETREPAGARRLRESASA